MKILQYAKIIFMILAIVAGSFILPIATAWYRNETHLIPSFLIPMIVVLVIASILFFLYRGKIVLSTRGGIVLVALAWVATGLLGAIPLFFSNAIPSFSDAVFESVSGFTTTGSTILQDVDSQPMTIHVWRCQMHWLGGMGIVALTVALFPLLGVGGFRLIKSETTGPNKGKVTAKITQTAKILWFIYFGLTCLQLVLLLFAGMGFFEALCHTFATLGTGGFSTRGASVGAFNSPWIDVICSIFMLLAGVNFSLYFMLFTGHIKDIVTNSEFKAYLKVIFISTLIIAFSISNKYGFFTSLRHSFFQVTSIITTTGFATVDYDKWPHLAKLVILTLMLIGGCSGSTAGGIKVIRWLILKKQAKNEMSRLLFPHGIFSIQLDGRPGRKDIVYSIAGFMYCYFLLCLITSAVAIIDGADLTTGITAAISLVGNVGPGFGKVGPAGNFAFFSSWAKWFFSFAMLAGRLELYTMIIYFLPVFWKK